MVTAGVNQKEKNQQEKQDNIVLIGMPGAGKSTIGVVLAKTLGMSFLDTDLLIQQREGRLLQRIIDEDGMEGFLKVEDGALKAVITNNTIIATGGSAVYSQEGMAHLKTIGKVIYLDVPFDELSRRLNDIETRGIAMRKGATLKTVYEERAKLYETYTDITINCGGLSVEMVVKRIMEVYSV